MDPQVFKPDTSINPLGLIWELGIPVALGALIFYISLNYDGIRLYKLITIPTPIWLGPAVAVVGIILVLVYVFYNKKIRFEVSGQTLRYFEKDNMVHQIELPRYRGAYERKTNDGDVTTQTLYLVPLEGGAPVEIDCEALGEDEFDKMYAVLKERGLQVDVPRIPTIPGQLA